VSKPTWMLPDWDTLTEFPIDQIARQLSQLCRYAGATPGHYSVARHSLLVADFVADTGAGPEVELLALLHDAHECWTGDILRPASRRVKFALQELQQEIDAKLWPLVGLDPCPAARAIVANADDVACEVEMECLQMPLGALTERLVEIRGSFAGQYRLHTRTYPWDMNEFKARYGALRNRIE
jgi:hypothetical protein